MAHGVGEALPQERLVPSEPQVYLLPIYGCRHGHRIVARGSEAQEQGGGCSTSHLSQALATHERVAFRRPYRRVNH